MSNFEFKNEYEIIEYLKKEFGIPEKHAKEVIKDITDIENNKYVDLSEKQNQKCVECYSSYRLKECENCHDLVCSKDRTYCKECENLLCHDCISTYCPFCYVKCCDLKKGNECFNYCEKYKTINGLDRINICWNCKSHFCEEHMIICQNCKAQHCGRCIHEGDGCSC
jgi:hypothetical protein